MDAETVTALSYNIVGAVRNLIEYERKRLATILRDPKWRTCPLCGSGKYHDCDDYKEARFDELADLIEKST